MGRFAEAISAGRRAVAQSETRIALGLAGGVQALLAPGLAEAELSRALTAFNRMVGPAVGAFVIADRLPMTGPGLHDFGFEHLVPLPDLLSVAPRASVMEHQARRLQIIFDRRGVAQCHWTGEEAGDLVRLVLQHRNMRGPVPGLAPAGASAHTMAGGSGLGRETILRPLQLPD